MKNIKYTAMLIVFICTFFLFSCENISDKALTNYYDENGLRYWSNNDGTCDVSQGTCADSHIIIPDFSPTGEKVIEVRGFERCKVMKSITLPNTIEFIAGGAFYDNKELESIVTPKSVKEIGHSVLYSCDMLKSITVEEGNEFYYSSNNCLIEKSTKRLLAGCGECVIPSDGSVETIEQYAFAGNRLLTKLEIPDSVTAINYGAFEHCINLENITFPQNLKILGARSFFDCSKLTEISIPDGITEIGYMTFCHCKKMNSVTLPDSLTLIDAKAFSFCQSLTTVSIPANVVAIGRSAFAN